MSSFLNNAAHASMLKEITSLDDHLGLIVQAVYKSKAKHVFLKSLGEDPATFVKSWLSSQKRDLDIIMGESIRGGSENVIGDEWRRGGKGSVWNTINARESVNVMLSKPPKA